MSVNSGFRNIYLSRPVAGGGAGGGLGGGLEAPQKFSDLN